MSTAQTATLTLTLRLGADPIEGSLAGAGGIVRSFRGWLELTSLLRAAAAGTPGGSPDDDEIAHTEGEGWE